MTGPIKSTTELGPTKQCLQTKCVGLFKNKSVSLQTQSNFSQLLTGQTINTHYIADWLFDVELKQFKCFSLVRKEGYFGLKLE